MYVSLSILDIITLTVTNTDKVDKSSTLIPLTTVVPFPISYFIFFLLKAAILSELILFSDSGEADLNLALDQNRFLEEHNIRLTSAVNDMKHKLKTIQDEHETLSKEHKTNQQLLKDLQTENVLYRTENDRLTSDFDRKLQVSVYCLYTGRQKAAGECVLSIY